MELKVLFSDDPVFVLSRAGVFLSSQPVRHNMILSILHARAAEGDPGRYWMAIQRDDIDGKAQLTSTEPQGPRVGLRGVTQRHSTYEPFEQRRNIAGRRVGRKGR